MSLPNRPAMTPTPPPVIDTVVPHLALKAGLLLGLSLVLLTGMVLYVLYARGVFDSTQRVVLVADNAEGVSVGMDLGFAGFAIGRVHSVVLGEDGNAHIRVDVPRKDARWLRTSSVFTLERSLVGGTRLRAFSGVLSDPPLPEGALRTVLRGDAAEEIPHLVSSVRDLLANLQALTATDGALAGSLAQLHSTTTRLNGPRGALGVLAGNEADARKIIGLLEQAQTLLASGTRLSRRLDGLTQKAGEQVLGDAGLVPQGQASLQQLRALLSESRASLRKLDEVLLNAQAISVNARDASVDLGALRVEVESSLRQVEHLVSDISRRWPLGRETPLVLP